MRHRDNPDGTFRCFFRAVPVSFILLVIYKKPIFDKISSNFAHQRLLMFSTIISPKRKESSSLMKMVMLATKIFISERLRISTMKS